MDKRKKRDMLRRKGRLHWHDEYSNAQPSRELSAQVERGIRAGQGRRRP
jgi:hypothetical protein